MKKKLWLFRPIVYILVGLCMALVLTTLFLNVYVFWVEAAVLLFVLLYIFLRTAKIQNDVHAFLRYMGDLLTSTQRSILTDFPIPVIVVNDEREIVWYNPLCRDVVLDGRDLFGYSIDDVIPKLDVDGEIRTKGIRLHYAGRSYKVYMVEAKEEDRLFLFYFIDETELRQYAVEYFETRPSVAVLMIDNYDELLQDSKESEKIRVIGEVERVMERFISDNVCLLSKTGRRDKYIAVIEERHMRRLTEERFRILDEIRQIEMPESKLPVTVSIGIGRGAKNLQESEEMANKALEMALGRGGDQVAVRGKNGFDFYGGTSGGVEKRTKVKTRIMASALAEIIKNSDNVLIMGHRFADLDCLGSAVGLHSMIREMGKPANIVLNIERNLADSLYKRLADEGRAGVFISPETAPQFVGERTLVVVVDTHIATLVECPALLESCENVVVIDHHRKMVGFIDDALIFYHEPYASSASEMVAELAQYIGDGSAIEKLEAEAMLSGIMLDTKNFTIKTGVRTFEASAFLRRQGADPVEVRKLFSGTMDAYQKRAQMVASASVYRNCAIAETNSRDAEIRLLAPQTADELLTVSGVDASFVMTDYGGEVSFSARSYGKMNVQLIMEYIGGGGHQTMAGAQIRDITIEQARERLTQAIDQYYDEHMRNKEGSV